MNAMTTTMTVPGDFDDIVFRIDGLADMTYGVTATQDNGAPVNSPYWYVHEEELGTFDTIDDARDEIHEYVGMLERMIDDYADHVYERY